MNQKQLVEQLGELDFVRKFNRSITAVYACAQIYKSPSVYGMNVRNEAKHRADSVIEQMKQDRDLIPEIFLNMQGSSISDLLRDLSDKTTNLDNLMHYFYQNPSDENYTRISSFIGSMDRGMHHYMSLLDDEQYSHRDIKRVQLQISPQQNESPD